MPRVCVDKRPATTGATKNFVDNRCKIWFTALLRRRRIQVLEHFCIKTPRPLIEDRIPRNAGPKDSCNPSLRPRACSVSVPYVPLPGTVLASSSPRSMMNSPDQADRHWRSGAHIQAGARLALAGRTAVLSKSGGIEAIRGYSRKDVLDSRVSLRDCIHPHGSDVADGLFSPTAAERSGILHIRLPHADGRIRCIKVR